MNVEMKKRKLMRAIEENDLDDIFEISKEEKEYVLIQG